MIERHFRIFVVRPTLEHLGLWSPAAEDLLLATAVHESAGLEALDQITGPGDTTLGPAYGVYQIEPATHVDVRRYLDRHVDLMLKVDAFAAPEPTRHEQLVTNLCYATAIARVIYWRRPEPLPAAGDVAGYARYWKAHYNTVAGKGTPEAFIASWRRHVERTA